MLDMLEELLSMLERFKGELSPDDRERFQDISCKVADLRQPETTEPPKTGWYLATIARIPLNYNDPFVVAVEANSRDHASQRLRKIYSCGNYNSPGVRGIDGLLSEKPTSDPDDLVNAKKYPLTAALV